MSYEYKPLEVIGGYEKNKDIFVEVVLGESGYLNKRYIGFTPEILERWHKEGAWQGLVQNVHPSKNHPLVYEPKPDSDASVTQKLHHYITKSNKYGFGTFVKTKLKDMANGVKRLSGIFRITDDGAKQAWKEGKFPRYSSSSVLIVHRNEKGLVDQAYPVASSSVDAPAYSEDVAKIHNECEGGEECVTTLAESGCFCKHAALTNFENIIGSQYSQDLLESSMADENKPTDSSEAGKPKEALQTISETHTSADGKVTKDITSNRTETPEEEEVDWKSKFHALEKDHKKVLKDREEEKTETNKKFEKIFKDKLETTVRSRLKEIPLYAFDNKEEEREKAVEKYLKFYPKLGEDEILAMVDDAYKLAPKILEVSKHASKKGNLAESGIISNDGKLIVKDDTGPDKKLILRAHTFGG